MSEPYLGEIRMFARERVPEGWAFCDGTSLPVKGSGRLVEVIGNTFGGDGVTTFRLPDLRGRALLGEFPGGARAASGGEFTHQLTDAEMPVAAHTHAVQGTSDDATTPVASGARYAKAGLNAYEATGGAAVTLSGSSVVAVGGRPHDNMAPYVGLVFCIAMHGIYPTKP